VVSDLGIDAVPDRACLAVTVLGCSGTYAGPDNACSGYLVRGGGTAVLLDAGPGVLASLQRHLRPTNLDAVVVSHSHPDHWGDVPIMRNALHYILGHTGVPLYSTAETLDLLEGVFADGIGDAFVPEVITDGSEIAVGDLRIRCSRTAHPPETLGLRVDFDGRSVAYSADTGPAWSLGELGSGIDLGICEATWLRADGYEVDDLHMTAEQAGRLAREDGVGELLVTHVPPPGSVELAVAEASDAYGAPVDPARIHHTYLV
jgi:ribonuclease BN (tRNA processing enzyme)